ncbi:thioredoxin domain-containing protein 6 [Monodelphis domestica]|uniref:NME/NM23 family member 9 n=1 Tax=Monodelphis domestica TaxID=13616 RepID=F7FRS4_MONDO|nr:thioredoxin domain-containing protein 6 [Monodelphis domestica]
MMSKKKETGLQVNINNQELWEEMLSSKGLTVVDVYQSWCGPCKPVVNLFRKIKLEVGNGLHFATAEADRLDILEKYRGKCEPTFLFYAGGELVAVVRGANGPLLHKTILDQMEAENKVLEQGIERKVIKDAALSIEEERISQDQEYGEEDEVVSFERSCTLAIIKPEAVTHGKVDEIILKIQEAGFEILTNEERIMTESETRYLYQNRSEEEIFEKLVQHMSNGPCRLLIISWPEYHKDVVAAWRDFIGPSDIETAKRENPDSLRAQYGTIMPFNAIHGSETRDQANRELEFFFPNFKISGSDADKVPREEILQ